MNRTSHWSLDLPSGFLFGVLCLLLNLLLLGLPPLPAAAVGTEAAEYYPLAVGNQWEYEIELVAEAKRERHTQTIAGRHELEGGALLHVYDGGKSYLIRSREGIIMAGGMYELRSPIIPGSMWSTEEQDENRPLHRVVRAGFPMTVRGTMYDGCVEIVVTTGFQAMDHIPAGKQERSVGYLSLSIHKYFAPNLGPILTEWHQKTREGLTALQHRSELVRFSRGLAVSTPRADSVSPLIEDAKRALRRAAELPAYPAHMTASRGGAAPYTEEAAAQIDAVIKKQVAAQSLVSAEESAAARSRRVVAVFREVFREAGYDYDATVARLLDDLSNRRKIPPRSFARMLTYQLVTLLKDCHSAKLDCSQLFSGEAAIAIRKSADPEPPPEVTEEHRRTYGVK